jgi:hypothetical protein
MLLAGQRARQGRWGEVAGLAEEAWTEYIPVHDGMRNANARTLDLVHRRFGQATGDRIGTSVYDELMTWHLNRSPQIPAFREHVVQTAMNWHWHRTVFRIVELPDRVSFFLEPCGSGGRMINEGAYYPSSTRPLSLISEPSHATFGETNFPSWCAHCADSNRSFLARGHNLIMHEGWTPAHRHGACAAHIFKSYDEIPDEYFTRVGLPRPSEPQEKQRSGAARVFTDAELDELTASPIDRIKSAADKKDLTGVLKLTEDSWQAWKALHDAYRCWFWKLAGSLKDEFGEETALEFLAESAWEMVARRLEDPGQDKDGWARYWRAHGGVSTTQENQGQLAIAIDRTALIEPSDTTAWRDPHETIIVEAITSGVRANGYEDTFGTLGFRQAENHFIHVLPR